MWLTVNNDWGHRRPCNGLFFLLIAGSFCLYLPSVCYGRAVNISNTWTLPQEGYSVFYRFFRDKISWFEADAVCQFHHANLVTVDNGMQFDAARAFLKELDVTEPVWIGLMRPQNSERFMWSNSKLLDSSSGYWADPLPVIESPLCAVIDPVRDFRWHALRCGGPETAAFLCELEVPDWASECSINSMPSLTVQYLSDSGTVELSRDCGESGSRHVQCKGRQDRNVILNELTCGIDDEPNGMDDRKLVVGVPNGETDFHGKSSDLLHTIDLNTIEKNVGHSLMKVAGTLDGQNLSKKPLISRPTNIDDQLLSDVTIIYSESLSDPKVTTIRPIKIKDKDKKKVDTSNMKKFPKKLRKNGKEFNDELMMGDQPQSEQHENEPLPHHKKSLPQDLKLRSTTEPTATTIIELTTHPATTMKLNTKNQSFIPQIHHPVSNSLSHIITESPTTGSTPSAQIMNFTSDHFLPPMLLVRTKFTQSHPQTDSEFIISTSPVDISKSDPATTSVFLPSTTSQPVVSSAASISVELVSATLDDHSTTDSNTDSDPTSENIIISSTEESVQVASDQTTIRNDNIGTTTIDISTTEHSIITTGLPLKITVSESHPIDKKPLDVGPIEMFGDPDEIGNGAVDHHDGTNNDFTNIENYQPYRPNRRRSLTKPETHSYLKKILG